MVVEMRKTGMALAGVIAFWAASQAFLDWKTLAAVRAMKARPDTVVVTKTDTLHDCGRRDGRSNDASPF